MARLSELLDQEWLTSLAQEWGAAAAVFAATVAGFLLIAWLIARRRRQDAARLERLRAESADDESPEWGTFGRWTPALASQIPETAKERRDFEVLLRQAGIYKPHASQNIYALRFLLLTVPLVVAGIAAVLADGSQTVPILLIGVLASALMTIIPRLYVYFRRQKRMTRIRQALPDTLDMLSMCVSGGMELGDSLEYVARQLTGYPECAEELMLLKRQAELGSLTRALAEFAKRVDLPETEQLVGLLTRGNYLGTELVGSLSEQADHLRVARRQTAMAQANKLPVKLVLPIVFCLAPAALILLISPALLQLRDFVSGRGTRMTATRTEASADDLGSLTRGYRPGAVANTLGALDQSMPIPPPQPMQPSPAP